MVDTASPTPSALHERILETLGQDIVAGRLPPGTRILSADVAERFGASRSAVREVVRVLESMCLVEVRRKAGVQILPSERWNTYAPEIIRWRLAGPDRLRFLHALSQLRSAVEPLAARLAAQHAASTQRAALVGAVMGMVETSHQADQDAYLGHDIAFHRVILESSGNPLLAGLADVVEEVLRGRTRHSLMPHIANPQALALHQEIAACIASGDAAGASRAMAQIVTEADDAVQAVAELDENGAV